MDTLRKFISSIQTTGAIVPYTNSSIKKILGKVHRESVKNIIEYGPGLGGFTTYILKHCRNDATLTCFEINREDFGTGLDALQDPRLTIHYTSCEYVKEYIQENSIDLIVSTIPFSLIGKETTLTIIKESHAVLKPGGIFITGQYRSFCKPLLEKVFGHTIHERHLNNLPPLQIMQVKK